MIPMIGVAGAPVGVIVLEVLKLANRVLDYEVLLFNALDAEGQREAAQSRQDGRNRVNDHLNNVHAMVMRLFDRSEQTSGVPEEAP